MLSKHKLSRGLQFKDLLSSMFSMDRMEGEEEDDLDINSIEMRLSDIRHLVAGGESQVLEFKHKINYPEKVIREMVAFANTSGGDLLIGVEDNGRIPGLKDPEEHAFALEKAIHDLCVPRLKFEKEFIPISEKKSVICYRVKDSKKTHYAKDRPVDRYGKAYIRVEDQTLQASREMTQILRKRNQRSNWGFQYGDKEAVLMKLIDQQQAVTLEMFRSTAQIPRKTASATLVLLVLAGVLQIIPGPQEDLYQLKNN